MQGKMEMSSGDGASEEVVVKKNAKPRPAECEELPVVLLEAVPTAEPVVVTAESGTSNVETSVEICLTIEDCTGASPPAIAKSGRIGAGGSESEASGSPVEPSWGDVADEPITITAATPSPRPAKWPRPAAENEEIDDVVRSMRSILMDLRNKENARLNPEDEAKVRSVLEYHPKAEEKMGSGVDYITIKRHTVFKDSRCFWVVRRDGSETDFSYHKCLKEKVAKEHPTFVDRYDAVYRAGPKGPRMA